MIIEELQKEIEELNNQIKNYQDELNIQEKNMDNMVEGAKFYLGKEYELDKVSLSKKELKRKPQTVPFAQPILISQNKSYSEIKIIK